MAELPMLSVKQGSDTKKMTANLLPCRIHHDGAIDPVAAYWKPMDGKNDTKEAYFRGRRLQGKTLPLPDGYRGVVVERAADELKKEAQPDVGTADDDEIVALETVGTMQVTGEFDEMVVWSHEATATAAADPYVRSVEEWLQVTDKIHGYEAQANDSK